MRAASKLPPRRTATTHLADRAAASGRRPRQFASGRRLRRHHRLGFTKHEHLDDTYLIHMNGRVYDYRLGRFLSVDPIISNPANSQSINPYSYIGNNPLSGVDPTGYACAGTTWSNADGTSACINDTDVPKITSE